MLILLLKCLLYQRGQDSRACSTPSLTIYITSRSFVEQSSLQVDILVLPPENPHHFEINKKQHTRISTNSSFPLGGPLWAALIGCEPICTLKILFQEAVNSIAHYFSLSDFSETAQHSKKLASSLHNIFTQQQVFFRCQKLSWHAMHCDKQTSKHYHFYDRQCTGEKEEDYNQQYFGDCALVKPSFQKLLEPVAWVRISSAGSN